MVFVPATQPVGATPLACFVPVFNGQLLVRANECWCPISQTEFETLEFITKSQHFIGYQDDVGCWAVEIETEHPLGPHYQWLDLRTQLGLLDEESFLLAGRALQILQWHLDHQFCGRCARPTVPDPNERAKICHHCSLHVYPRLSPCIIVLITRGDECLLARHARSKTQSYTTLAGFVEVGERIEDAVHREILEEVGVTVQSLRYFDSQPWPFPGQLMLGFHVEYAAGEIQVDGEEIIDAGWYRYDKLPKTPSGATLAGQLIGHFVSQRHQQIHKKNP